MYTEIVNRLLAYPQRGQIKIDFDVSKKIFQLTIPIFSSRDMPKSVKTYVEARKNATFKPHTTSYQMEDHKVLLVQEFPFELNFQETLRQQVDLFWKMSKQCHRMFSEMAVEEQYKNALYLDTHFKE